MIRGAVVGGIAGGLGVGIYAVIVNLFVKPKTCPECGAANIKFCKTPDGRKTTFGGWMCSDCGCEMDFRGNVIAEHADSED